MASISQARIGVLFVWAILLLCSCSAMRPSFTHFIPFTDQTYPHTAIDQVTVYKSRLELPGNYIEIGVIKIEGDIGKLQKEVFQIAAEKGAQGIVYEGNNAVLFRWLQIEEDKSNEKVL